MLKKRAWKTIQISRVEVTTDAGVIVGSGVVYWDGKRVLEPQLQAIGGGPLPPRWYTLRHLDTPILGIMARNVQ